MPYEVTGMFADGRFEVKDENGQYETFDVNELLADKAALDGMVKVFNEAPDQEIELDGYVDQLARRRVLEGL